MTERDYTFKDNAHILKFERHVSDTPYSSTVSFRMFTSDKD